MAKIVTFGEIMLRLAPQGYQRFQQAHCFDAVYGGAEANVAVSLANSAWTPTTSPPFPPTPSATPR